MVYFLRHYMWLGLSSKDQENMIFSTKTIGPRVERMNGAFSAPFICDLDFLVKTKKVCFCSVIKHTNSLQVTIMMEPHVAHGLLRHLIYLVVRGKKWMTSWLCF